MKKELEQNNINLYSVRLFEKDFLICLDSRSDEKEDFEKFFNYIIKLKPINGGRKILLTTEPSGINNNSFIDAVKQCGVEFIFSVGLFDKYIEPVRSKDIWFKHAKKLEVLQHYLLEFAGSDDIICIKGLKKYDLETIIDFIKGFGGSFVKPFVSLESFPTIGRKLNLDHLQEYKERLSISNNISWGYYFPFLYMFSKSNKRDLLVEKIEGSFVIYMLAHERTEHLFLYFPPLPMDEKVLKKAQEKIYGLKGSKRSTLLWIDENDKSITYKHFILTRREDEFIYNYEKIKDLKGSKLKNLRYNLKRFEKDYEYTIRDYTIRDYFSCIKILKKWKGIQNGKYRRFFDDEYTKNCLRFSHRFDKKDLFGKVIIIAGEIKGFAFGGEVYKGVANIFVVKSDPDIKGLSYFLKFKFLKLLEDYDIVNDSCSLSNEGLKKAKESFDPLKMHRVYIGREGV